MITITAVFSIVVQNLKSQLTQLSFIIRAVETSFSSFTRKPNWLIIENTDGAGNSKQRLEKISLLTVSLLAIQNLTILTFR